MGSGCSKINNNNETNIVNIDIPSSNNCSNEIIHDFICDIKNMKVFNDNELINIQNMNEQEKMLIINEYNLMFEYITSVAKSSDFHL